jgi:hypothetical protein
MARAGNGHPVMTDGSSPVSHWRFRCVPAATKLFVSDTDNNRVMIFDGTTLPAADYYPPDSAALRKGSLRS